jgi:hypothetical protein
LIEPFTGFKHLGFGTKDATAVCAAETVRRGCQHLLPISSKVSALIHVLPRWYLSRGNRDGTGFPVKPVSFTV